MPVKVVPFSYPSSLKRPSDSIVPERVSVLRPLEAVPLRSLPDLVNVREKLTVFLLPNVP